MPALFGQYIPAKPATGSIATTADLSTSQFEGVTDAEHISAIRELYLVVNPDKLGQVCRRSYLLCCLHRPAVGKCVAVIVAN